MATREQLIEAPNLEKFLATLTEAAAEQNMLGNGFLPTEERLGVFHFTPEAESESERRLRKIIGASDSADMEHSSETYPVLCQDDGILRWKTGIRRYDENGETLERRPVEDPPPDVLSGNEEWEYMTPTETMQLWQRHAQADRKGMDPIEPLVRDYLKYSSAAKAETPEEKPDGSRGVLQLGLTLKKDVSVLPRGLANSRRTMPAQGDLLNLINTFSPYSSHVPDIATIHHPRPGGGSPGASYADRGLWLLGLAVPQDARNPNSHVALSDPLDGRNRVSVKSLIRLLMGDVPRGWRRDVLPKLIEALEQIDRYYHKFEVGKKRKLFSITEIPDMDADLNTRVSIHAVMPPNAQQIGARINVLGLIEAGKKSRLSFTAHIKLAYMWDALATEHCGFRNGVVQYHLLYRGARRSHFVPVLSDYDLIALVTDHDFASGLSKRSDLNNWTVSAKQAIRRLEDGGYCDVEVLPNGWRIYPPSASEKLAVLPEFAESLK